MRSAMTPLELDRQPRQGIPHTIKLPFVRDPQVMLAGNGPSPGTVPAGQAHRVLKGSAFEQDVVVRVRNDHQTRLRKHATLLQLICNGMRHAFRAI